MAEVLSGQPAQPPAGAEVAAASRDVFLCHASQDAVAANGLVTKLEAAGLTCWIAPRDVTAGTRYADSIVRAINATRVLVLLLSKDAVVSPHVGKEIERASSKRHPIIAIRLDAAPLPPAFEYFLSESHWLETAAGNVDGVAPKVVQAVRELRTGAATPGSPASPAAPVTNRSTTRSPKAIWVVALLLAVAVALALWHFTGSGSGHGNPQAGEAGPKSIAVLPFVDMSEKRDQGYLGDGLAEEILDQLSKIPGLRVIGRTSSFQFKGSAGDLRKIGAELGVTYVVEGSVRRSGEQLKVTVQLVDARDGARQWSNTYEASAVDALQLERQIAAAVSRTLQVSVTDYFGPGASTKSPEAHDLYLRGIRDLDVGLRESQQRAITEFSRAVELDPAFTNAWVGLAAAYDEVANAEIVETPTLFRLARQAIERAIALDPRHSTAYAMRAYIRMSADWDWSGADEDVKQSLTLGNSTDAYGAAAKLAIVRGQLLEAEALFKRTLATDPLNTETLFKLAFFVYPGLQRFEDSDRVVAKLREISPEYEFLNGNQALNALYEGRLELAMQLASREADPAARDMILAIVYHAMKQDGKSDDALGRLMRTPGADDYYIADVYSFRGDTKHAMDHLERAYQRHSANLWTLKTDPFLANARSDPRFVELLRKMNLPE